MMEPYDIGGTSWVVRETDAALYVKVEGVGGKWIPKSVVHDDSECYKAGQKGKLIVAEWWAEKQDWI